MDDKDRRLLIAADVLDKHIYTDNLSTYSQLLEANGLEVPSVEDMLEDLSYVRHNNGELNINVNAILRELVEMATTGSDTAKINAIKVLLERYDQTQVGQDDHARVVISFDKEISDALDG